MYIDVMGNGTNDDAGFTLKLGEPWKSKLDAFCAAYYDGSKTKIIREAIDHYIELVLGREIDRRKRYEVELQRLREDGTPLRLVKREDGTP